MALNDSRALRVPTPPQGVEIASFGTYLEAQKAVDVLADGAFAVQAVTIVGSDLRMVERVTGRLSYPRVALAGALSGVWFGIFVGLLFSLFAGEDGNLIGTIVTCAAIGAAFGSMFGVISYSFTGGKRDFVSSSQVVASRYSVLCLPELAGEARAMLTKAQIPLSTGVRATAPHPAPYQQVPGQQPPVSAEAPHAPTAPVAPDLTEPPRYGQRIEDDKG